MLKTESFSQIVRQLFIISLANFIFPLSLNIGQLICISTNRSFLTGTVLLEANHHITIIGVVFATIWANGTRWAKEQHIHSTIGSTSRTGPGDGPSSWKAYNSNKTTRRSDRDLEDITLQTFSSTPEDVSEPKGEKRPPHNGPYTVHVSVDTIEHSR
jgi:hypothetical protein